jgi:hypothetical protein
MGQERLPDPGPLVRSAVVNKSGRSVTDGRTAKSEQR